MIYTKPEASTITSAYRLVITIEFNMSNKNHKIIVITGCSSGIGLETAVLLAKVKDYKVRVKLRYTQHLHKVPPGFRKGKRPCIESKNRRFQIL